MNKVLKALTSENFDCVVDFGCGSGEIIGEVSKIASVPCFGLDINAGFLDHCREHYPKGEYIEMNLTTAHDWWQQSSYKDKYKKPLVICCNNTLLIIPIELRADCISNMLEVAGEAGKVLTTIWDGRFFSHALIQYYTKNPDLCGKFTIEDHADFGRRHLSTPKGYCTTWLIAEEVMSLFQSYDISDLYLLPKQTDRILSGNYVEHVDIGIFVWLNGAAKNTTKDYYDSVDAQQIYTMVWGDETIHIGRYDLVENLEQARGKKMAPAERILKAQKLHEEHCINRISRLMKGSSPFRIADFGCGYGGFLRDLTRKGSVWSAMGCDISGEMIARCKAKTAEQLQDTPVLDKITWSVESFLCTSLASESTDIVFSMDAFMHVGKDHHAHVLAEAWRVLRPGGWLIFNDVMARPGVFKEDPSEEPPMLNDVELSALGSVENYRMMSEAAGYGSFEYEDYSDNIAKHYSGVKSVLTDLRKNGDLLSEVSEEFVAHMGAGLGLWEKCGEKNLHWGVMTMQKTGMPATKLSSRGSPGRL